MPSWLPVVVDEIADITIVTVALHLEGGVPLDGTVSDLLLLSLFDPHSPGHDGAIVIDTERVRHFGVHLPLSANFAELSSAGTRHAAALGLSRWARRPCGCRCR